MNPVTVKSVIAEHVWMNVHPVNKGQQQQANCIMKLIMLSTRTMPEDTCCNRYELHKDCIAMFKKLKVGKLEQRSSAPHPHEHMGCMIELVHELEPSRALRHVASNVQRLFE